ncbi:hypothetical protein SAMN06296427_105266 [Moheibacter sediminis]|uniref:Uncharacterized protein n=1 Tax=Moheibacter sediminis TaxID=1434700 RepID=A0A1W2B545_9FLAO|nr:hypothetical protein SAMN06296427_105266 [Moheibacter sediminis]
MTAFQITNMDTGARYDGRLTIVDVHTKGFWKSDPVQEFYGIREFN